MLAQSSPQHHNASLTDPMIPSMDGPVLQPEEDASPEATHNHRPDSKDTSQVVRRRSTREKAPVAAVATDAAPTEPPVTTHQAPRKQHYEFLRASPALISAFREARTQYHDAVYAWWYSVPRRRDEKPTADDIARAKADPRVRRAGRQLNRVDADLTRWGVVVKTSTLTSGWAMYSRIRDEELRLDQALRELHEAHERETRKPQPTVTKRVAATPDDDDARAAKRRRVGATRSVASASTSRASTHDTTMTTPEPETAQPKPNTKGPARLKRRRFSRR